MSYPPEPWHLRGQMHVSVFLLPIAELPPLALPDAWKPVRLYGRAIVSTAWVSYEPGGVLTYRELMATVMVRRGWQILPTIRNIWVDSPISRDGGRGLWAIPKEMAKFEFDGPELRAQEGSASIAADTVRPRFQLPGRWPLRFSVVQWEGKLEKISPVSASAGLRVDRATFAADERGPLGFLAGRRPWLSLTLRDFEMHFGHPVR